MSETETKADVADPKVLLGHHLKKLKLPTVLAEYDKQARQCAEQGIDHPRYLLRLVELELPGGLWPTRSALRAPARGRQRKMIERRLVWPRSGKHHGVSGRRSSSWRSQAMLGRHQKPPFSAMLRIACRAMDSFDFNALPDLNKVLVLELARAEFIVRRENIIALGPSAHSGQDASCPE